MKKNLKDDVESLDAIEIDEITTVNPQVISTNSNTVSKSVEETIKTLSRGQTPPIDGEQFSMKRCYQFRPSTLKKLNELKANHCDVNVYLSTIVDAAIMHYYRYIFKEKDN